MFLLLAFLCGNVLASLPPRPQYPGLRLAFETDFDTLADFTARDNYVQTPYAESCYKAANVALVNGNLVLTTRAEHVTCAFRGAPQKSFAFTSGWVDTFDKLELPADGLLEVRAQLPSPVHRVWPAAWVIDKRNARDQGLCWPLSIEYDVYESTGGLGDAQICGSVHWGTECDRDRGNQFGCTGRPSDGGFHTYAIRFSPQRVIWILDGIEYYRNDVGFNGEPLSTHPFALILNTAISSNLGGPPLGTPPVTVTHAFDWVRVWAAV